MNKTLRITLVTIGIVSIGALLVLVGFFAGRYTLSAGWADPVSMMSGFNANRTAFNQMPFGSMRNQGFDPETFDFTSPYGGMMGSGMMGTGMMGTSPLLDVEPLSVEAARGALEDYLQSYSGGEALEIGEIMIFDNHAYAQLIESETGIGAQEVLVDPVTLSVFPEFGPNMMWNTKYGMMGRGMGMMGAFSNNEATAELPVSEDEAVEAAQRYLDNVLPGARADEHADRFYGYYTLHIQRDGKTVGMLSVNGYTRQVFLHTWHGELVEMAAE